MGAASPRALDAALELASMPVLAEAMRRQPLPADLLPLIRVAGGCQRTCEALARQSGREPRLVASAACFYLEKVLFHAEGDPCRTLGAPPGASREELREHLIWLMKWLHPDRNRAEWESVFAARVIAAWEVLQTAGCAAGRDSGNPAEKDQARQLRLRWIADPVTALPVSGLQLAMVVFAWVILLALLIVPEFRNFWSPFAAAEVEGSVAPGDLR